MKFLSTDSMHSFSYAPGHCRGTFAPSPDIRMGSSLGTSLGSSWQFYNFLGGAGTGAVFPTTVRNPVSSQHRTVPRGGEGAWSPIIIMLL